MRCVTACENAPPRPACFGNTGVLLVRRGERARAMSHAWVRGYVATLSERPHQNYQVGAHSNPRRAWGL